MRARGPVDSGPFAVICCRCQTSQLNEIGRAHAGVMVYSQLCVLAGLSKSATLSGSAGRSIHAEL